MSNRSKVAILALAYILLLAIGAGCFLTVSLPEAPSVAPSAIPATAVSIAPTEVIPIITMTSFSAPSPQTPLHDSTITPSPTFTPETPIVFAVIGDYGARSKAEGEVADLIKSWNPDFIITTGDNNYPDGSVDTIDASIGQYFHEYIYPYRGNFGEGSDKNRFFPSLGNHDWMSAKAKPYLDYFHLEGNERYYTFNWGPIDFFVVDSDSNEPDGVAASSKQANWLDEQLGASNAPWKIVYMHHPPYSSGTHGSVTWMRWPFKEWGASAVLSGHDHLYERLEVDGLPYFINGLGGGAIYDFKNVLDGSQVRYNANYGAMRVEATSTTMTFQFIDRKGEVIDTYEITH